MGGKAARLALAAINWPPIGSRLPRFALLLATAVLQAAPAEDPDRIFNRMEVQIPMRDGIKLYTDIYIPKKSRDRLPFLLTRTPYGATSEGARNKSLAGSYKDFVEDGYIFVFQDIRGRYKSGGRFVWPNTPSISIRTITRF